MNPLRYKDSQFEMWRVVADHASRFEYVVGEVFSAASALQPFTCFLLEDERAGKRKGKKHGSRRRNLKWFSC
jgi:hypothetical protein